MQLSRLVLPDPFGPMTPSTEPGSKSRLTSSRAPTPPKCSESRCTLSAVARSADIGRPSEVELAQLALRRQLVGGAGGDPPATVEQVDHVRQTQRHVDALLGHQDRHAAGDNLLQRLDHALDEL